MILVQVSLERNHAGGDHLRPLALGEQLHALCSGIRPLVVLAGQVFHGKNGISLGQRIFLVINGIDIWLGKDRATRGLELFTAQPGNVVPVQQFQIFDRHPQVFHQVRLHVLCFHVEAGFLFDKYSDYVRHCFPRFPTCTVPPARQILIFIS